MGTSASGDRFDLGPFHGDPRDVSGLLSGSFREERSDAVEWIADRRREEDAPLSGIDAHVAAVEGLDLADRLHEVTVPALVLHGLADEVVPPAAGRGLADGLPRGRFEGVTAGSHLFFVEQARVATAVIDGFLDPGTTP